MNTRLQPPIMARDGDDGDEETIEVLLSAIEHHAYCPRQCGLIHVEATYQENVYTIRGNLAHSRIDTGVDSVSGHVRSKRDVALWSDRLGIRGKADLVEFRPDGPYPVEYKVGKRKSRPAELQLCAQALCLEEMLGESIQAGAIYYHGLRRRRQVFFDDPLRSETVTTIGAIRDMIRQQELPLPANDRRCTHCSLSTVCMPHVVGEPDRLRGLQGALFVPYEPKEREPET